MAEKAKPIPDGYHAVTPYLSVKGADKALPFYQQAFGAKELYRLELPSGQIGHAEIQIGDSRVMLAEELPGVPGAIARSPKSLGGTSMGLRIYVDDVDSLFQRAVEAGAKVLGPLHDQFYGDRSGILEDPFGHLWTLASHKEDVPAAELRRRMASLQVRGASL